MTIKTVVNGIPLKPGATFLTPAEAKASQEQALADDLRAMHGDAAADEYLASLASAPATISTKPTGSVGMLVSAPSGIHPPATSQPYIRILKPRDSVEFISIDWRLSFDREPEEDGWDTWPLEQEP